MGCDQRLIWRANEPEQDAEHQDAQVGRKRAGVERHRQFTAGDQQQMPAAGRRGKACDLMAAQSAGGSRPELTIVFRSGRCSPCCNCTSRLPALSYTAAARRGVAADLVEQRLRSAVSPVWVIRLACSQLAQGLQGLRSGALVGNPVRHADKRQVGHQQYGGQQVSRAASNFWPTGRLQVLAQGHEMAI